MASWCCYRELPYDSDVVANLRTPSLFFRAGVELPRQRSVSGACDRLLKRRRRLGRYPAPASGISHLDHMVSSVSLYDRSCNDCNEGFN